MTDKNKILTKSKQNNEVVSNTRRQYLMSDSSNNIDPSINSNVLFKSKKKEKMPIPIDEEENNNNEKVINSNKNNKVLKGSKELISSIGNEAIIKEKKLKISFKSEKNLNINNNNCIVIDDKENNNYKCHDKKQSSERFNNKNISNNNNKNDPSSSNNNNNNMGPFETTENDLFQMKLKRFFNEKNKKKIVLIFLSISILLFIFSIIDSANIINNKKNENKSNNLKKLKKIFMSIPFVFILEMINLITIIIFYLINHFAFSSESHKIYLILILIIIVFGIFNFFLIFTNKINKISVLLNFILNLLLVGINSVFLLMSVLNKQKKKNMLHNIDEIMNFSLRNEKIKKPDIINNNKEKNNIFPNKPFSLVEEGGISNDIKK